MLQHKFMSAAGSKFEVGGMAGLQAGERCQNTFL